MNWSFQAFVLCRLSLAVCCAASESQSSSGRVSASVSEQRDHGPFSSDVLATLTLILLVPLNPVVSRDVRPTPGVPTLTSRAGVSLSFLFLTPPAAPVHPLSSRSQSGSSKHTGAPVFSLVASVPRITVSVCFLSGAGPRVPPPPPSPVQVATASQRPNTVAPSPFRLSSNTCARSHGSPLCISILSAGDVHL